MRWMALPTKSFAFSTGFRPKRGKNSASLTCSHSHDTWRTRHREPGKTGMALADSESCRESDRLPFLNLDELTLHWIIKIRLCARSSFQSSSTFLYLSPLHSVYQICRGKLRCWKSWKRRNETHSEEAWPESQAEGGPTGQRDAQTGVWEKYSGWRRKRGTRKTPIQT